MSWYICVFYNDGDIKMETNTLDNHKDPALAAILSFLITGTGSIYAGNTKSGLIFIGVAIFFGVLAATTTPGFIIVNLIITIYSSFYAYADAKLANEGKSFVRDPQSPAFTHSSSKNPFLDQLGILSSLHDAGLLNDDEFKDKKESLIRQLTPMTPYQTNAFLLSLVDVYKSGALTQDDLDLIKSTIK